ncbi:Lrp/AsnC family transcriptional regulator [Candidatus Woesearchaeota archaeon]|nr:Lrp/AsnC family transcriptional regulator [Candidatus Woesearchaeota archaeon]MBT4114619.1 Lrp/AsnC family transcriptional regulator [Candidatus Woesearchaeota archaeon]MBT4248497.1 Lrp/AsnC family transcriptional regulator [Candidatus Woesearchaeota archaeon]
MEYRLDDRDRKIIMILQENARESLTSISRRIGLSVDAVHQRIKKMTKVKVFAQSILVNPVGIGYPLMVDIKIKIKDASEKDVTSFISYLKSHPRVVELIQIMGDWDFTCVLLAKDANDLAEVTNEIRYKFNKFIADWRAMILLKHHKFEKYDMTKL